MNKSLSKIITQKSKVRNKYLKWPSRENFLTYKKVKTKCNSLVRKPKKKNISKMQVMSSHHILSHFGMLSNKGPISYENIIIKAQNKRNQSKSFRK